MIQHILMKDQVNHIKKEGLWYPLGWELSLRPKEWTESVAAEKVEEVKEEENSDSSSSSFSLEGNPNRRRFYVESDDSDS